MNVNGAFGISVDAWLCICYDPINYHHAHHPINSPPTQMGMGMGKTNGCLKHGGLDNLNSIVGVHNVKFLQFSYQFV